MRDCLTANNAEYCNGDCWILIFFFRVNLQLLKLQITTATIISSFKICISTVRIIFIASFHSQVKMNSTNWPASNVWVFNAEVLGSNPVEVPKFFSG